MPEIRIAVTGLEYRFGAPEEAASIRVTSVGAELLVGELADVPGHVVQLRQRWLIWARFVLGVLSTWKACVQGYAHPPHQRKDGKLASTFQCRGCDRDICSSPKSYDTPPRLRVQRVRCP
jgi:hypothetical protein